MVDKLQPMFDGVRLGIAPCRHLGLLRAPIGGCLHGVELW